MEMPPLGLEFLASYIQDFAEVRIMDLRYDKDISGWINDFKPDIIGINFQNAVKSGDAYTTGEFCRNLSNAVMLAGGLHATICPDEILASNNFDIVVRGEGEIQMLDIVKGIPNDKILGISYKDEENVIHHNEESPLIQDLDQLPHPARHLRSPNTNYSIYNGKVKADLLCTSRGCKGNCTFCSPATYYRGRWRGHSPDWVLEDIKQIKSKFVFLSDDDFLADLNRTEEICDLIIEEGIEKNYHVQTRMLVGHIDLKKKLAKAGFNYITFGIETPKKELLKKYRKGIDPSKIKNVIKEWYDAGVKFVTTSMVYGDPDDTESDLLNIGEFAREIDAGFADMIWMTPYPKLPLRAELENEGLIISNDWSKYTQGILLVRSKKVNEKRLKELRQLAWFKFFTPRKFIRLIRFYQWSANEYNIKPFENLEGTILFRSILFGDIYESDLSLGMKKIRKLGLDTYFKEYINTFPEYERDMTAEINEIVKFTNLSNFLELLENEIIQVTIYHKNIPLTNLMIEVGENKIERCIVDDNMVTTPNQIDIQINDLSEILTYESGNDTKNLIYILGLISGIFTKNLLKHSYSSQIKNLINFLIDSKVWKNFDIKLG